MKKLDLGERPASRGDLPAWYAAALVAPAASGLSVADYAAEIGVTPVTLYQWRRRLERDAGNKPTPGRLVEVTVARSTPPGSSSPNLIVRLVAGRRDIEVPPGFDSHDLRRLITTIEQC
jgi:hypothetical protein